MSNHPIDIHVGARVRHRRSLLGMTQEKLGNALGLCFQQVQKYERGVNRISASKLYDLSRILDVPISFFFDDIGEAPCVYSGIKDRGLLEISKHAASLDLGDRRTLLEVVKLFVGLANRSQADDAAKAAPSAA